MQYGSYKRKILILNKIINFIYKIRFILIGIFVLSLTTYISLNAVTGTNTTFVSKPSDEVEYGDTFDFLPQSILNSAYVEYRNVNEEEWSEEKPKYVGTYEARGYSYNGWDNKIIGETFRFSIKKKDILLWPVQDQVHYGNNINYDHDPLIDGDRISNISFDFSDEYYTDDPFKGNEYFLCGVTFNLSSIVVLNNDGDDVTQNYNFFPDKKEFKVYKRKISISSESMSCVYDGLAHTNPEITFKNGTKLVEGDRIEVIGEPAVVGPIPESKENKFGIKILDESDRDRTAFYDIEFDFGTLEVKKREICVETSSLTKIYDGHPFDESDFKTTIKSGSLVEDHYLEVKYDNLTVFKPLQDGESERLNTATFKIIDKNTKVDVSECYEISSKVGTFNISKRPITLKAESIEKTYDSSTHEGQFIIDGEIAETDELIYENVPPSLTDVGEIPYTPVPKIKAKDSLEDVTSCYSLTIQSGSLKILKRNLVLESNSINKSYDGLAIEESDLSVNISEECDGLSDNHEIEYSFEHLGEYFIPNAVENTFTFTIKNNDGSLIDDPYLYYNIEINYGSLQIKERDLTITTPSPEPVVYTGEEYFNNDYTLGGEGLAKKDLINFTTSEIRCVDVGKYTNYREFNITNSLLGNIDVTNCYNITTDFGTYEIGKNTLTIETNNYKNVYQGKELDNELSFVYSFATPVSSEIEVVCSLDYQNKNIATFIDKDVKNSVSYKILKNGEDITNSFNVIEEFGTINISKAPLKFESKGLSTTYDGNEHSSPNYDDYDGLLKDDFISITDYPIEKDAGSYQNKIEFNIFANSTSTENVTKCYEIEEVYNNLDISKRDLTINFENSGFNCVYDGYTHGFDPSSYDIESGSLASGDSINITKKQGKNDSFLKVGTYSFLNYYDVKILDSNANDVTKNYNLDKIDTSSVISKRDLEITIGDYYNEYDENAHQANSYTINSGSLSSLDDISISSDSYIDAMDQEEYFNTTVNITNYNGITTQDVTDCYNLDVHDGKVKIDKKVINISLYNTSRVYDGTDLIELSFGYDITLTDKVITYPKINTSNKNVCTNLPLAFNPSLFKVVGATNPNLDYTKNYSFNIIGSPTYSISPSPLTITVDEEYRFFYDGQEHYIDTEDFSYNGELYGGDKVELVDYNPTIVKDVSDTGKTPITVEKENIKVVGKDGSDNTSNYDIYVDFISDTYTVYGEQIEISSLPIRKTFDNKPFNESDFKITYSGNIKANHTIECTFTKTDAVNSGIYDNEFNVKIVDSDTLEDVSINYYVTKYYGTISISAVSIDYTINNISQSYKGTDFAAGLVQEYAISDKSIFIRLSASSNSDLAEIENLTIIALFDEAIPSIFDVGLYELSFKIKIYIDGVDVTDSGNFTFSSPSDSITFNISAITLIIYNYGGEYDLGDVDETLEFGGSIEELIKNGDTIYFGVEKYEEDKFDYELLDMSSPGIYTYEDLKYFFDSIKIVSKNGVDVTKNYIIDYTYFETYIII